MYVTKDSGDREDYHTGSRRDTNKGKPRYDLVGVIGLIRYLRSIYPVISLMSLQEKTLMGLLELQVCARDKRAPLINEVTGFVFGIMENLETAPTHTPTTSIKRVGELMKRGAEKYGEHNWTLGQPSSRSYESALRHFIQFMEGDEDEDHLAGVVFNLFSIQHVIYMVTLNKLGRELDDMYMLSE